MLVHGGANRRFSPRGTEWTLEWLRQANGSEGYVRHVVHGYGHADCLIGTHAARDVFPLVLNSSVIRERRPDSPIKFVAHRRSAGRGCLLAVAGEAAEYALVRLVRVGVGRCRSRNERAEDRRADKHFRDHVEGS